MTEKQEEYAVQIKMPESLAVADGKIRVIVEKLAVWINAVRDYQKLNVGATVAPLGAMVVEIPVDGVVAHESLSPEQLAETLVKLLEMAIPACRVFVGQVEDDFGYKPPGDWEG